MNAIGFFESLKKRAFEYFNDDQTSTNITQQQNQQAITLEMVKAGFFENVGYRKLSDNADVKTAVDKIADLVSNMTIQLIENTEKGDRRLVNSLSRKIDIEPCKNMTRKTWITRIVTDLLLNGDGNAILEVKTDNNGLITDLIPMNSNDIRFESVNNDYLIHYQNKVYKSDEVVHFVINPDKFEPWRGTGYRVALADVVKNLDQANKTKNSFMSGQYMPNIIVKVDALSDELTTEEGKEAVKDKFLRSKAGEPLIIPADLLQIEQIKPLNLKDIAIIESSEIDKKTVAAIFGVPSFFLGIGTFNREEYNNFINTRIMSIAQTVAQTLTRDLLFSPSLYFRLNPRSLYSYNLTEIVTAGGEMVKMNAMRRNELRNWVGLPPDDEMEELLVLENYIPQEDVGNQKKLVHE